VIALGGAAELVLTPDAYANAMGYFGERNADEEHRQLFDKYMAEINGPSVQAYLDGLSGGNADNPELAAAIRTSPGGT
jgi:hypothetical protein